jgi:hypothetical protein
VKNRRTRGLGALRTAMTALLIGGLLATGATAANAAARAPAKVAHTVVVRCSARVDQYVACGGASSGASLCTSPPGCLWALPWVNPNCQARDRWYAVRNAKLTLPNVQQAFASVFEPMILVKPGSNLITQARAHVGAQLVYSSSRITTTNMADWKNYLLWEIANTAKIDSTLSSYATAMNIVDKVSAVSRIKSWTTFAVAFAKEVKIRALKTPSTWDIIAKGCGNALRLEQVAHNIGLMSGF